jgi:hypothetical protein
MNADKQHAQMNADFLEKNPGMVRGKFFIFPSICAHPFFHPRSSADKGFYFHG